MLSRFSNEKMIRVLRKKVKINSTFSYRIDIRKQKKYLTNQIICFDTVRADTRIIFFIGKPALLSLIQGPK